MDAEGCVHGLGPDEALVADHDPHGVEEDQRHHAFQRTRLLFGDQPVVLHDIPVDDACAPASTTSVSSSLGLATEAEKLDRAFGR